MAAPDPAGSRTPAGHGAPDGQHPGARAALWKGVDQASVMSVELIAAILTWTGIGWLVDRWLGTMPWFLVAGALIGNAAGLFLIWLRSGREGGWQDAPTHGEHEGRDSPGPHRQEDATGARPRQR